MGFDDVTVGSQPCSHHFRNGRWCNASNAMSIGVLILDFKTNLKTKKHGSTMCPPKEEEEEESVENHS